MTATAFHVTTADAWERIRTEGLVPQIGPRSEMLGESEPRVYLFPSLLHVEDALSSWLGESIEDDLAVIVLEVDLMGLPTHHDPAQFEITCTAPIAPERIRGTLDENLQPLPASDAGPLRP